MVTRRRLTASRLVAWVRAREGLRAAKESGSPELWTSDPVLRIYRFTNVRRRDDRVSRWLRANVYGEAEFRQPSLAAVEFAALCRWVNWPPTLEAVVDAGLWPANQINLRAVGDLIDARVASGQKGWTGAYMVRANPGRVSVGKGRFVAEQVVGRSLRRAWPELQFAFHTRMRRPVWRVLADCLHWGHFMAGQVVDDLTWTSLLESPRDDLTWAPQGPGSIRGYNRLKYLPLNTRPDELEWCAQLQEWRSEIVQALGAAYVNVTLMDVQNCLCEFDKYERARLGEGRPRSYYRPETAY